MLQCFHAEVPVKKIENSKYLYLKRPGDNYITKLCAEKKLYLDDMTEYNWLNKNIPYSATKEERQANHE